jgi:hypothetical protein
LTEVELRGLLSDLQYGLLADIFLHKDILLPIINDAFRVVTFLHTIRILSISVTVIHNNIRFGDGPKYRRLWLHWNSRILLEEALKVCMTFLILGFEEKGTLLAVFLFFGPAVFLFFGPAPSLFILL